MALLFNHLKDWFCAVTRSSKEAMIAVLNMSHYIQRRVMFLTSIALMAEPSSPAEVIRFIISHRSSCWVEEHVTAKWLWHRIGKNNQHPQSSDYINGQELAKFPHADGSECWLLLDTCTKTLWGAEQSFLKQLHILELCVSAGCLSPCGDFQLYPPQTCTVGTYVNKSC